MLPAALLPIGDDDRGIQRAHIVVWFLIVLNVVTFMYEITRSDSELTKFIFRYGAIPVEIRHLQDLPPLIHVPILATLVTSMFLHGGFLHIGGNMLFLWIFGDNIEDAMGHLQFLMFYLLCGVAGTVLQVLVHTSSEAPIIGASGAIAGVMAAYLVLFPRGMVRVATILIIIPLIFRLPALIVIGFWFALQLFNGYASLGAHNVQAGTAFFAHIGGFVTGFILVRIFADPRAVRRQNAARAHL